MIFVEFAFQMNGQVLAVERAKLADGARKRHPGYCAAARKKKGPISTSQWIIFINIIIAMLNFNTIFFNICIYLTFQRSPASF